jgi:transcriptional regulator with PAS, ATPase and Fis domain
VLSVPCGVITRREPDSDPDLDNDPGLVDMVENFEKAIIESVLVKHGGNASLSARSLKVPKTTLADKLRKYNLSTKRDDG